MRTTKRNYFCNKINDSVQSNDNSIRQSWSLINNILGRKKKTHTSVSELIVDDVVVSGNRSIAESFNDFFVNIGTKLASEIENDSPEETLMNNHTPSLKSTFTFTEICTAEVISVIRNLKTSKSTGIDNIPAKILKISANIISSKRPHSGDGSN